MGKVKEVVEYDFPEPPYQFPMGKVKAGQLGPLFFHQLYQFPMGKVKSRRLVEMAITLCSINSLWER